MRPHLLAFGWAIMILERLTISKYCSGQKLWRPRQTELIEIFENTQEDVRILGMAHHYVIAFQVNDGSISSLAWNNELLPLSELIWVNDLKICELAFIGRKIRQSPVIFQHCADWRVRTLGYANWISQMCRA